MIRSMTGYSRVETEEAGFALTVSIRGTNHRFLDPQLRLPSSLEALEPVVRRLLKEHVSRGHVEISVGFTGAGATELEIDRKLLAAYLKGYQTLKQEFGAGGGARPDGLAARPRLGGQAATARWRRKSSSASARCWRRRWRKPWRS